MTTDTDKTVSKMVDDTTRVNTYTAGSLGIKNDEVQLDLVEKAIVEGNIWLTFFLLYLDEGDPADYMTEEVRLKHQLFADTLDGWNSEKYFITLVKEMNKQTQAVLSELSSRTEMVDDMKNLLSNSLDVIRVFKEALMEQKNFNDQIIGELTNKNEMKDLWASLKGPSA